MDKNEALNKLDTATAMLMEVYAWLENWTPEPPSPPVPAPPVDVTGYLPLNKSARYPFPKWDRKYKDIRFITVHHSAGSRDTTNITYWNAYHTQTKGWSHVGYHFGIAALSRGEPIELYQMNPIEWFTWHDSRNHDTVGVCLAGDLRAGYDVMPTEKQADLFGQLMAWLIPQLPNLFAIVGHKRWQATACPGDMDFWMHDLIQASRKWGVDIEPLVSYRAYSEPLFAEFLPKAFGRKKDDMPPLEDYEESEGMGDYGD